MTAGRAQSTVLRECPLNRTSTTTPRPLRSFWSSETLVVMRIAIASTWFLFAACSHEVSGGGLLLNVQPSPPTFAGAFDFDLQPSTSYTACVHRPSRYDSTSVSRWVLGVAFDKLPGDALTVQAIATAANHLIDFADADTLVMTRVVTESKGENEVCATVFGRGVVLKKAERDEASPAKPAAPPVETPAP